MTLKKLSKFSPISLPHTFTVLGIDPGTRTSGYALLKVVGRSYIPLDYGCIRAPASLKLSERYLALHQSIDTLLEKHEASFIGVETQYLDQNFDSAVKVGMARGTVIITGKRRGIPILQYTPSEVKKAVVGNGKASKDQVNRMVGVLLSLAEFPSSTDASDALAIAICCVESLFHQTAMQYEI